MSIKQHDIVETAMHQDWDKVPWESHLISLGIGVIYWQKKKKKGGGGEWVNYASLRSLLTLSFCCFISCYCYTRNVKIIPNTHLLLITLAEAKRYKARYLLCMDHHIYTHICLIEKLEKYINSYLIEIQITNEHIISLPGRQENANNKTIG